MQQKVWRWNARRKRSENEQSVWQSHFRGYLMEKNYWTKIYLLKFQWSIIVKNSMVQVSTPSAKYLTATNTTKKFWCWKVKRQNSYLKKVNGKNIQLKKIMANRLAAGTFRLECSTAMGLILKSLLKTQTLRKPTSTV